MGPGFGRGIGEAIVLMFVLLAIALPLGAWKLIEIIVWLVKKLAA